MKSILLTTTALVAFAGAAVADGHTGVSFSGSATLGYNNTDLTATPYASGNDADNDDHFGFYSDLNLDVKMTAELDNGVTVSASADVDELDAAESAAGGVTLTVSTDTAALIYGDTSFAAEDFGTAVGSMDADGDKGEQDGEVVLKGTVTAGTVSAAVSYVIDGGNAASGDNSGYGLLSFGASADLGMATATVSYESGEVGTYTGATTQSQATGLKVSATVAGADVAVGYFNDATADLQSLGVSASMPVGAVTVKASYVNETNAADTAENNWDVSATYAEGAITATVKTDESEDWAIEGTYDMGNGLTVAAGLADAGDDKYVGGTYDLGGGASLLVSYADDSDADEEGADNDIGAQDYQVGTTVAVSFKF
jgi:hypothetical protein